MKLKGIKNQTNYIMVHLLLFFAGIIIDYLFGHIIEDIGEMPFTLRSYQDYFSHNFSSCLLLIFIGFLTYGLLSWIPLVYNAIVFGVAIKLLLQKYTYLQVIFLFTHGIFEIPTIFLSIYLGRVFAIEFKNVIKEIFFEKQIVFCKDNFKKYSLLFLILIFMLLIAAILEENIVKIFEWRIA